MHTAACQWREQGATRLPTLERDEWVSQYFDVLARGFAAQPLPALDEPPKRRGRRKQTSSKNLLDDLLRRADQVLAFLDDLSIPFTNDVIAYCTPSAWLASLLNLTFILVMRVLAGRWEQHDPTAISMVHGNAPSSPPIPDRLWRHSIGLSGLGGG